MALDWLKYWRNTLVDAARTKIDVPNTLHRTNCIIDFNAGSVSGNIPQQLIDREETNLNNSNNIINQNNPNWQIIDEVPVLISPFYLSLQQNNNNNQNLIIYPFWVKAILNRQGYLSIDDDTFPYIPRDYLAPLVNQNINFTFSTVEDVDKIFSLFNGINWTLYWNFISQCFLNLTQLNLENYQVQNYNVVRQNTIVVNNNISGVSDHIIKLYNYLINNYAALPLSLLNSITNEKKVQLSEAIKSNEFSEISIEHLGQMGNKFALSFSQRLSLFHYLKQSDGEVLAINGPPGTGKTTLLQSVVANEVVQSAIDGNEPRLILVASNNNQAVTNIIDSFASIANQNDLLTKRWLPDVNSFVMYLPGSSREVNNNIHFYKIGNQGFPNQVQNQQYLSNAKQLYIQNFNKVFKTQLNSVQEIVDTLRAQIIHHKDDLEEGIKLWQKYKTLDELFFKLGVEPDDFLTASDVDLEKLYLSEDQLKKIESDFSDYLENESFWIRLFSFLKFIREKRVTKFKQIFRNCPISYKSINFNRIPSIHKFFDDGFSIFDEIKTINKKWIKWKKIYHLVGNPPSSASDFKNCEDKNIPYFYDELERTLKYKQFYLAVHYWEGRWILETISAINNGYLNRNNEEYAIKKWQRFAMLTPCFVSTFYMTTRIQFGKIHPC